MLRYSPDAHASMAARLITIAQITRRCVMAEFFTKERIIILIVVIIAGLVLGRLIPRAFMNMVLGGTLFGGDIL